MTGAVTVSLNTFAAGLSSWRRLCTDEELNSSSSRSICDDGCGYGERLRQIWAVNMIHDPANGCHSSSSAEGELGATTAGHSNNSSSSSISSCCQHQDFIQKTTVDCMDTAAAGDGNKRGSRDEDVIESPATDESVRFSSAYVTKVEYGLKLGYREELIHSVIKQFGPDISHDELLRELIKRDDGSCASESNETFNEPFDAVVSNVNKANHFNYNNNESQLRPIIIDGSNVAMSHGNKKVFSCRGIGIAVEWFKARGHKEITVFVPQWRKENAKQDSPITDQEILTQLERDKNLVFTPSRRVNNKRISCYDDRYILKLAVETGGVIVSNDNYRDLTSQKPEFKKVVDERLLMYSFVNDRFMPPDDPLGRHGPTIDSFLRKKTILNRASLQPCPYAKKCTYGNKCKFYHPERIQKPLVPVAQQLAEDSQTKIKDFKERTLRVSVGEKQPVGRTQSLDTNPSKPSNDLSDLSSLAISILSSGKNPTDEKENDGRERRSLPLSWLPATWNGRHDNLRPVHSDPLRQPTKFTGHLALAKKLSDDKFFTNLQSAGTSFFETEQQRVNNGADKQHTALHRKMCFDVPIVETQEPNWMAPTEKNRHGSNSLFDATFQHLTKENEQKNFLTGHSLLGRMHSAPLVCLKHSPVDVRDELKTEHVKMPLHRVSTSPLMQNKVTSSLTSCSNSTQAEAFPGIGLQNSQRHYLFPQDGRSDTQSLQNPANVPATNLYFPEPRWMHHPGSDMNHLDTRFGFSQVRSKSQRQQQQQQQHSDGVPTLMPSTHIRQGSTFHFGRNSSFQFIPSSQVTDLSIHGSDHHQQRDVRTGGYPRTSVGDPRTSVGDPKLATYMKLCGLFDPSDVQQVMTEHPGEMDSKTLCGYLLQLDQQRRQ